MQQKASAYITRQAGQGDYLPRLAGHLLPPLTPDDRHWVADLWRAEWGGDTMVSSGKVYHLNDLKALVCWTGAERSGLVTFTIADGQCEVLSLNALVPGQGVGGALLTAVEEEARQSGCGRTWLITTNDNLEALRFYQRRGYRLVAVRAGAVDRARLQKPTIPLVGNHGIPLHDELELEKRLR